MGREGGCVAAEGQGAQMKLGSNEAGISEIQELEKKFEALRSLLVTFWFRNLGFHSLLVEHRPRLWSSHIYTYHEEFQGKGGKLVVFTPQVDGRNFKTVFDASEGRIHRYDLSFNGREIVFAWQKNAAEPFQIYRINVDGTGLTQLTSGPSHNFDPCWLPDGDIAFISTRDQQWALCLWSRVGLLYRMDRGGGNLRKLSYGVVHDLAPSILNDGRIVYTRWEYVDKGVQPIQSLWTINPDGTMLQGFYGNRVPGTFFEARAIPGSGAVLCTLTGHMAPISGAIGIIDPRHGDNAPESLRNVTPGVSPSDSGWQRGGVINGAGPYEAPYPIDGSTSSYLVRATKLATKARSSSAITRAGDSWRCSRRCPAAAGITRRSLCGHAPPRRSAAARRRTRRTDAPRCSCRTSTGDWSRRCAAAKSSSCAWWRRCPRAGDSAISARRASKVISSPWSRVMGPMPRRRCGDMSRLKRMGPPVSRSPLRMPLYFMALDGEGRVVQRMRSLHFPHAGPETELCRLPRAALDGTCYRFHHGGATQAAVPARLAGMGRERLLLS